MGNQVRMNSVNAILYWWLLIALLFFVQGVASILLSIKIGLTPDVIGIPIGALFAGGVAALAFFMLDRKHRLGQWKWWVPAGIYVFFIYLISNRSFYGIQTPVPGDDFHPVEYLFLGLFLGRVWYQVLEERGTTPFFMRVMAAGMLVGASDELHQSFVPGRDCSFGDFLFDTAGLLAACVVIVAARHYFAGRKVKD